MVTQQEEDSDSQSIEEKGERPTPEEKPALSTKTPSQKLSERERIGADHEEQIHS